MIFLNTSIKILIGAFRIASLHCVNISLNDNNGYMTLKWNEEPFESQIVSMNWGNDKRLRTGIQN